MNLNNLLQLKGTFYDQKNKSSFGPPNLPKINLFLLNI